MNPWYHRVSRWRELFEQVLGTEPDPEAVMILNSHIALLEAIEEMERKHALEKKEALEKKKAEEAKKLAEEAEKKKLEPPKETKPKPPPEPFEIREIRKAQRKFIKTAKTLPKYSTESKVPHHSVIKVSSAALRFLSKGQGMDSLIEGLESGLPYQITEDTSIKKAIEDFKERLNSQIKKHATALLNREANRFKETHSPEFLQQMDTLLDKLAAYPWENSKFQEAMQEKGIVDVPSKEDCYNAAEELGVIAL